MQPAVRRHEDLTNKDSGALGHGEDPLAEAMWTADATSTQASSDLAVPFGHRDDSFCCGVWCGKRSWCTTARPTRLCQRSAPATHRQRYEVNSSDSEHTGPLATPPFRPTVAEPASARRDELEDPVESDHEDTKKSQSFQATATSITIDLGKTLCRRSQHNKVRKELVQCVTNFECRSRKRVHA